MLLESLYKAGTYDQVNLGGLACLEVLVRRLAQMIEATSKGVAGRELEFRAKFTGGNLGPRHCADRAQDLRPQARPR